MKNRCDNYTKDTHIVIKRRTTGITRFQKTNHSLFTNYQKYLTMRHTLLEKKEQIFFLYDYFCDYNRKIRKTETHRLNTQPYHETNFHAVTVSINDIHDIHGSSITRRRFK